MSARVIGAYKAKNNILIGVAWPQWGEGRGRKVHIYMGLWVLVITTPIRGYRAMAEREGE